MGWITGRTFCATTSSCLTLSSWRCCRPGLRARSSRAIPTTTRALWIPRTRTRTGSKAGGSTTCTCPSRRSPWSRRARTSPSPAATASTPLPRRNSTCTPRRSASRATTCFGGRSRARQRCGATGAAATTTGTTSIWRCRSRTRRTPRRNCPTASRTLVTRRCGLQARASSSFLRTPRRGTRRW
jgi:hypothetical protein